MRDNLHIQPVSCLWGGCDGGGFTSPGPTVEVNTDNQTIIPLGDLALTLQREVGTQECSLAWESDHLNLGPTFYALMCDTDRVPSSMYLSLPTCKWLIEA